MGKQASHNREEAIATSHKETFRDHKDPLDWIKGKIQNGNCQAIFQGRMATCKATCKVVQDNRHEGWFVYQNSYLPQMDKSHQCPLMAICLKDGKRG